MNGLKAILAAATAGSVGAAAWWFFRDNTADTDTTGTVVEPPNSVAGPTPSSLGAQAMNVLLQMARQGVKGTGPKGTPGYHRGQVIDQIQRGFHGQFGDRLLGQPWCGLAGVYSYEAAAQQRGRPRPFPAKMARSLAVARNWAAAPLDKFLLSSPKVGAALVIPTKVGEHVAFIAEVIDQRTVKTAEGNHKDSAASVKRTIDLAKDKIVNVEAWINAQQQAPANPLVGSYDTPFDGLLLLST